MKRIINPTIVHSATQPTEKVDLWIKALPNNQNTLMIFDNGYENVDSNLTERLDNEAQERSNADEELNTTLIELLLILILLILLIVKFLHRLLLLIN